MTTVDAEGRADVADLRGLLYGLHAVLRLHTAQEDESYLSLAIEPTGYHPVGYQATST